MVAFPNRFNPNVKTTRTAQNSGVNAYGEKKKPTLQQMNDLYNNWCNFQIPYFPAGAATAMQKKRTDAMEKYVKDNNLDIDVNNLELFFEHVKQETGKMGGIPRQQAVQVMLNNYIENGYDPNLKSEKLTLTRETSNLASEYYKNQSGNFNNNFNNKKMDLEFLRHVIDKNILQAEINSVKDNVNDNIDKAFETFTVEDKANEQATVEAEIEKIKTTIEDSIKNVFETFEN